MRGIWVLALLMVIIQVEDSTQKDRQKRQYMWFNRYREHLIGLLWGIPFHTFFPGLANAAGRKKRSLGDLENDFQEVLNDFTVQVQYNEEIRNLLAMFHHLQIYNIICQEQVICILSSDPDEFSPLSDVIMKELRQNHGPIKKENDSLIWRYMTAAKTGMISSIAECQKAYPGCSVPVKEWINTPSLKLWRYISNIFGLELL